MVYDRKSPGEFKKVQFCQYCGTKLDENARFCKGCGEPIGNTTREPITTEPVSVVPKVEVRKENPAERKIVYEGNLHKCPSCGEVLKSFQATCPACGHEIRSAAGSSAVRELAMKLEGIAAKGMPPFEEDKSLLRALVGKDLKNREEAQAAARRRFEEQKTQEKVSAIINFAVPNTKEDILEFMILACSHIDVKSGIGDDVTKAWLAKLDQVYQKAEWLLGGTSDFSHIKVVYDNKMGEIQAKRMRKRKIIGLVVKISIPMMIIGFVGGAISGDPDSSFYLIGLLGMIIAAYTAIFAFIKK